MREVRLKFSDNHANLYATVPGNLGLCVVLGTVKGAPPGRGDEVPTWPGIPASRLEGKKFQTFAIDFHNIRDGLIKQTWHLEDYGTALIEMISGSPAPNFGFNRQFIGA